MLRCKDTRLAAFALCLPAVWQHGEHAPAAAWLGAGALEGPEGHVSPGLPCPMLAMLQTYINMVRWAPRPCSKLHAVCPIPRVVRLASSLCGPPLERRSACLICRQPEGQPAAVEQMVAQATGLPHAPMR